MFKNLAKIALLVTFVFTFYVSGVRASQHNVARSTDGSCVWDQDNLQCVDSDGGCGAQGGTCTIFTPGHCICQ